MCDLFSNSDKTIESIKTQLMSNRLIITCLFIKLNFIIFIIYCLKYNQCSIILKLECYLNIFPSPSKGCQPYQWIGQYPSNRSIKLKPIRPLVLHLTIDTMSFTMEKSFPSTLTFPMLRWLKSYVPFNKQEKLKCPCSLKASPSLISSKERNIS